jgi:hypothetical protein
MKNNKSKVQDHFGTLKVEKNLKTQEFGLREQAEQYPMMLVLSFVYPCNALCPHCPYTNSSISKKS